MGRFSVIETGIKDLKVIKFDPFLDARGYFYESYNKNDFIKMGITEEFVQDNQSMSSKGVLRGLHFQINYPQSKLVRCLKGKVFDVAVDIRNGSPTYGKWVGVELSEYNHRQLFIPRGFAHGFSVLSDEVTFQYKCDNFYAPNNAYGIAWDDKTLNIDWKIPNDKVIVSEKDKKNPIFV